MARTRRSGILTGTAGVYFVASQLAARGFHAAPTFGNAPSVDILVGSPDGSATLCLQVKTSWYALRKKGKRGEEKVRHHYEWAIGKKSAQLNQSDLFIAFADLKGVQDELPDVFIVPSEVIFKYFEPHLKPGDTYVRFHPKVEWIEKYRNNWQILRDYLDKESTSEVS